MAKVKITQLIPNADPVFEGNIDLTVNAAKTKAVFTFETGASIVITGEGLKEGVDGLLSKGTVETVSFRTVGGPEMINLQDLNFDAKNVGDVSSSEGAHGFYLSMLSGKDTIVGSSSWEYIEGMNGNDIINGKGGDDEIYGGNGDDILTGGAGADTFILDPQKANDNDVITDLDIEGEVHDTLAVDEPIGKITKTNGGDDTLITFENGATVQIEGITRADFLDFFAS